MEKNKLYTVNKWNRPMFGNQFLGTGEYPNYMGYTWTTDNSVPWSTYQQPQQSEYNGPTDYSNFQFPINYDGVPDYYKWQQNQQLQPLPPSWDLLNTINTKTPDVKVDIPQLPLNLGNGVWDTLANKNNMLTKDYMNSKNLFGLSKALNPLSKGNIAGGLKAMTGTPLGKVGLGVGASIASGLAYKGLSGGFDTGVGSTINTAGNIAGDIVSQFNPGLGAALKVGSGAVGGAWNHAMGIKTDSEALANDNSGINYYNNFVSNANTNDQIKELDNFTFKDPYTGGWFRKRDARKKNEALRNNFLAARDFANRSISNNIYNIGQNSVEDYMRGYGAALGGSLKAHGGSLGKMYGGEGDEPNTLDTVYGGRMKVEGQPVEFSVTAPYTQPYTYYSPWDRQWYGIGYGGAQVPVDNPGKYSLSLDDYMKLKQERAKADDIGGWHQLGDQVQDLGMALVSAPMFEGTEGASWLKGLTQKGRDAIKWDLNLAKGASRQRYLSRAFVNELDNAVRWSDATNMKQILPIIDNADTAPQFNKDTEDLFSIKFRDDFYRKLNEFTDKYGYERINPNASFSEAKKYAKSIIDRHNSFYRGVEMPNSAADVEKINALGLKGDDVLKYVATHEREPGMGIWITPHGNAGIYGGHGKTAVVKRPYKLGSNPLNWFDEGDFALLPNKSGLNDIDKIIDPWVTPTTEMWNSSVPSELVYKGTLDFDHFVPKDDVLETLSRIRHFRSKDRLYPYSNEPGISTYNNDWDILINNAEAKGDFKEAQYLKKMKNLTSVNQKSIGGNLFPDGGVLPEVVVTPSAEDRQVRKNLWSLFPDKDMRDSVYAYYDRQHVGDRLAQNEFLNNITTLHNLSGNPAIHRGDVISFLPAQYRKSNGTPRPHYVNNIVAPNDMYNINNFNDYLDELTHAYQYHGPKRYGLDTISWPGDIEINGKSGYDREGHPENAAHKVIGDAMKRYLIDNGLTMRNGKTNRENFVDKLALGIPDNYPVGQDWLSLGGNLFNNGGGIHIDPSKKGTFTAAASKHGMGVQEFASKVLSNKEDYSPAMVKKANFARNASKWHGLGGNLYSDGGPKGKKLIDDINSRSSADFVNRLKDKNRSYIPDWNNRSNLYDYNWATHKMSWATDENGDAIVYPEVQTVNGKLHDFTDPWYGHGKWDGFNNAVENGDTLRMSPEQADWFTRNYKEYYPKGNTFAGGGYTAASFIDDFSQDPIAAVMRYNQMQSDMVAQREAMEEERAKEEQMQNLQKQLMEAQTNYQGLQSLYDSQATAIKNLQDAYGNISPIIPPGANPGLLLAGVLSDALGSKWSTGTLPKNNKNWNYIKRKLKASGKFTDTQIDGIGLNLMRESRFDPEAIGDGGSAFGIAQWHGNRKPKDKTLDGQITHLINTLAEYDGKEHWIGKKNYNGFMNARTPEEAHYYIANGWERPKAVITDSLRREMNNSLINAGYAFGGELGTNGTDWYNGLLQVNEGSSHEMNPLGGVPMGVDQQGTPNFVEEGETVFNKYVFSRRKENEGGFNVPLDVLAQIGIKPTKKQLKEGISYAEASKVVAKESEERPMDDISQRGLEHGLGLLAQSQEQQRQEKQMMEQMAMDAQRGYAALGGRLCATGGSLGSPYVNLFATAGSLINPEDPPSWWNFADRVRYEIAKKEEEARNTPKAKKTKDVLAERAKKETSTTGKKALDEFYGRNSKSQNAKDKVVSKYEHRVQNPRPEEREANRVGYSTVVGWDEPWDSHLGSDGYPNAGFYRLTSPDLSNLRSGVYWTGNRVREDGTLGNSDVSLNLERGWTPNGKIPYMASPVFHEWGYGEPSGYMSDEEIEAAVSPREQLPYETAKNAGKDNVVRLGKRDALTNTSTTDENNVKKNNVRKASADTIPTNNEPANTGATDVNAPVNPSTAENPRLNPIESLKKTEAWKTLADAITASKIKSLIDGETASEGSGEMVRGQDIKPLPTWMRYAPIFVNGAMALTDMLGLTNKPDYEYANKLEAMANSAGYAPNISAPHIGDYMGYRPMDRLFFENQMQAAQRAADRNVMNTAGGNRATAMAGLLGNNYNGYVSLGTLARQAEEYNLAQRMKQAEFNRGTNQANAQWDLQAQMANAQYRQMAKHYQMNAMAQAIAQRNAIDQMIGNARALNLTNFLNGLSGVGRENFAMNQINSDNGWDYGYGKKNGWSGYKWATPPYVKPDYNG